MIYENKIAIVIKSGLKDWQKLNATAFLASAVSIKFPETHGRPFINKSGSEYLPFIKLPVLVYSADNNEQLQRVLNRARERVLHTGIYTVPLFATKNEEQNLEEISKETDESQDLAGVVVYGLNKKVDKALDGLKFHP